MKRSIVEDNDDMIILIKLSSFYGTKVSGKKPIATRT